MKLKINLKAPNFKLPSTGKTIFELNKFKKDVQDNLSLFNNSARTIYNNFKKII